MAIEVHERRLLLPPPSACATSLSAFYSAPNLNKVSSFLNRSFAIKGGFFSFPKLSTSLATSVFFFFFSLGIFAT